MPRSTRVGGGDFTEARPFSAFPSLFQPKDILLYETNPTDTMRDMPAGYDLKSTYFWS